MRRTNPLLALCLMAGAAAAQELSWTELANRPELWPAQCIVKVAMKFEGGATVQTGQKVDVAISRATRSICARPMDGPGLPPSRTRPRGGTWRARRTQNSPQNNGS